MNFQQKTTNLSRQIGTNCLKMKNLDYHLHYSLSAFFRVLYQITQNHDWKIQKTFKGEKYTHEIYECECGCIKHAKYYWNRKKPFITIINSETHE